MSQCLWHFNISNGYGVSSRWDAKKIPETTMAQIMDLSLELLNAIITMLAMSPGGAADLARAFAICKEFMTLARHPDVLRVVNFENFVLVGGSEKHCRRNSLLYRCVQAGNLAAECRLGKAILLGRTWSCRRRLSRHFFLADGISYPRLVRSFILHASSEDIAPMQVHLFSFFQLFAGSNCILDDIFHAINNLCSYETIRSDIRRVRSQCENEPNNNVLLEELSELLCSLAHSTPPPGSPSYRDRLLMLLD